MSLRRAVFQIIDFKKCRNFEIIGQRSLKVIESGIPFDRLRMVSCYYPTVALSVFEIFDFKNADLEKRLRVHEGH